MTLFCAAIRRDSAYYYFTHCKFLMQVLEGDFSLESKRQQVSLNLQDSSEYNSLSE